MSKALTVSMIVIGDEILNGRTTDLNGSWLSKFLFKKGLEFKSLRFIRDNAEEMTAALSASFFDSDIVITSGGIGPTLDDKTKNTLADYFKKSVVERNDVAELVAENYIRFGRSWTPETNHYHFFPQDFIAINNPRGLAPGLAFFTTDKKLVMAAPGVPREFTAMVEEEFYPLIKKGFADRLKENHQCVIRTQGVPEEKIFFELCPTLWQDLEAFGKVSSLPHTIGIDIVIGFTGSQKEFEEKSQKIKELVMKTPLAPHVWQWGNRAIHDMVLEKALEKKCTFAFAESCTGGLTSSKITDLSGSSAVFYGGIISYDNSIKENVLKVKKETLEKFGAVSVECAIEMARGVRELLKTDYAVSITGIAGPTGGSKEKPVGTVAIGIASKDKNTAVLYQFPGDRVKLKDRFSDKALLTLLELME
nr:CinA family nicotinamide mononucleotide deamidase-related protein [Bacteriovorax sp. HI3]